MQPMKVSRESLFMLTITVPLLIFAVLTVEVQNQKVLSIDQLSLKWLHAHATTALDQIMLLITTIGGEIWFAGLLGLILLAFLMARDWTKAGFLFLAVGGAAVLNPILKMIFLRPRPTLWVSLTPETGFAFPSGHATGSTALAAALVVLFWNSKWRIPILVLGLIYSSAVGLSRLYLGVHYPSDVLAGTMFSLAWVAILRWTILARDSIPKFGISPSFKQGNS